MEKSVIQLQGITKHFTHRNARKVVLDNIDLDIKNGQFVVFIGPTGCGKTTLLKIIGGFEEPSSGNVLINGSRIAGPGPERGYVFQQPNLFPWLTVLENAMFAVRHGRGDFVSRKNGYNAAIELLDRLGLHEAHSLYPHQISGGMKARTALARVLMADPPVLLMDEPFAALDAQTKISMHSLLLGTFQDTNKTIIFVTHDVEEALLLADTICVMGRNPGNILKVQNVPFRRPRSRKLIYSPEFVSIKEVLINMLQGLADEESDESSTE